MKSLQDINPDNHTRILILKQKTGGFVKEVSNSVVKSGLLINERWDEFPPSVKEVLLKHGIAPFK